MPRTETASCRCAAVAGRVDRCPHQRRRPEERSAAAVHRAHLCAPPLPVYTAAAACKRTARRFSAAAVDSHVRFGLVRSCATVRRTSFRGVLVRAQNLRRSPKLHQQDCVLSSSCTARRHPRVSWTTQRRGTGRTRDEPCFRSLR